MKIACQERFSFFGVWDFDIKPVTLATVTLQLITDRGTSLIEREVQIIYLFGAVRCWKVPL